MIRLTGGGWLLFAVGLAFALTFLSASLLQDIGDCAARLVAGQDIQDRVWDHLRPLDFLIFLACVIPSALWATFLRGRRQWAQLGGTIVLAAMIGWHMYRTYSGLCSVTDLFGSRELVIYVFFALLMTMLIRRGAELWAERAGE
ncbi:hypothetical protein H4P12_13810 [Paracoccus sp. 11-3]|uniref:Uncharacterized protein n=1 Tax=Paracoccus amoyensis TaxID=2760093 RepID=A0A926GIU9_9RHOB|nr:hypothetical protein [Paracoccus amoyensis]MBC9247752.1 hypothetical protein [Paracoccus amoyensis]